MRKITCHVIVGDELAQENPLQDLSFANNLYTVGIMINSEQLIINI